MGRPGRPSSPHAALDAVAALLVALASMLIQEYRSRLLRGDSEEELRSALLKLGDRGFLLLKSGAKDYCRRPA